MSDLAIRRGIRGQACVTLLRCLVSSLGEAGITVPAVVEDQVELHATHQAGVPFHHAPGGSQPFQRLPSGTVGMVIDTARDGSWLQLNVSDGRAGWITRGYGARTIASASPLAPAAPAYAAERAIWTSPEGCQQIVAYGGRMRPRDPFLLRVATWNIRWFHRGCPSHHQGLEQTTDIPWLACTMAWMHVDIRALQEILATPDAEFSLNALRSELPRLTGSAWEVDLQSRGSPSDQHVGFLWNRTRVTRQQMTDVWELNRAATSSTGHACAHHLRPGRYAFAHTTAGADFHRLSVHFDSGTTNRDYEHRRQAARRLSQIAIGKTPILQRDRGVVVLGDYNPMGQEEAPSVSAQEELAVFDGELAPGFRRLPMTPHCTEYHDRNGGALDHFVVSTGMQEMAATARVTGYYTVAVYTTIADSRPVAYDRLSDHCPVVVEIQDRDLG